MNTIMLSALLQGAQEPIALPNPFVELLKTWGTTLGWALVGSIAMGFGLIIALSIFTMMTRKVDEWELIKQNNLPISIIMAAVVLGTSIVIAVIAKP